MARWATTIEVAGQIFTGCRGEILDADQFLSEYKGSVVWANSGKANAQITNVGAKGNSFGLQMETAEASKILLVASAVAAADAAGSTFVVKLTSDLFTINHNCIRDFTQRWLTHGKTSEGWVENVTMRFISQSAV